MTSPPDLDANRFRRSWPFYGTAVLSGFVAGLQLWVGNWPCAVTGVLIAAGAGTHPWMRRQWYQIGWAHGLAGRPRFVCPTCKATSFNPHDIDDGYCGRCQDWTAVP